jgi:coenzyme F420-0:L-glutamate ligase/coenzyme F420-1:gamma-L-glutamate ligase
MASVNLASPRRLELIAPDGFPSVMPGAPLAKLIVETLQQSDIALQDGDIIVLAQKIVSKAEGRYLNLRDIAPTEEALRLAGESGKDARLVQAILDESSSVVRCKPGVLIVRHKLGCVLANAGIDQSNVHREQEGEWILLLPIDPDHSAREIGRGLQELTGGQLGVMIIDSWGRAWRIGTCGACLGSFNMMTVADLRGQPDWYGRILESTVVAVGDELAAAASLLMGQASEGTPVVIARGTGLAGQLGGQRLVRPLAEDLFQ